MRYGCSSCCLRRIAQDSGKSCKFMLRGSSYCCVISCETSLRNQSSAGCGTHCSGFYLVRAARTAAKLEETTALQPRRTLASTRYFWDQVRLNFLREGTIDPKQEGVELHLVFGEALRETNSSAAVFSGVGADAIQQTHRVSPHVLCPHPAFLPPFCVSGTMKISKLLTGNPNRKFESPSRHQYVLGIISPDKGRA